ELAGSQEPSLSIQVVALTVRPPDNFQRVLRFEKIPGRMDLDGRSRTKRDAAYRKPAERMVVEKHVEGRIVRTGCLPEIKLQSSLKSIVQKTSIRRDIQRNHSCSALTRTHPH